MHRNKFAVWGIALILIAGLTVSCGGLSMPAKDTATPPPAQALYTLAAHGNPMSVAFSPDGALLASEWTDETVRVWRTSDWSLLHTFEGDKGWATLIGFSPDSSTLVSISGDCYFGIQLSISFWDMSGGNLLRSYPLIDDSIEVDCTWGGMELSDDASTLALASESGRVVHLRRISDGAKIGSLEAAGDWRIHQARVDFSRDGSLLAIGDTEGAAVWQLSTGTLKGRVGTTYDVTGVAFSPDGTLLASGGESVFQIWRVSDGALLNTMKIPYGEGTPLDFSPDGTVLAGSSDYAVGTGDVRLWRTADGTMLSEFDGPTGPVADLVFSPDGSLLAWTADDGTIQIWAARR